jgi:hypothetical protein
MPLLQTIIDRAHICLRLLLRQEADCTNTNNASWTKPHIAAFRGDVKTAEILAAAKLRNLDPEALDKKGRTPRACKQERRAKPEGSHEAFEKLIKSLNQSEDKVTSERDSFETTMLRTNDGSQIKSGDKDSNNGRRSDTMHDVSNLS